MTAAARSRPATYDQFWLAYLRAHSRRRTRAIHYCGITIIIAEDNVFF